MGNDRYQQPRKSQNNDGSLFEEPYNKYNRVDSYRDRAGLGKSPVKKAGPKRFINKFDKKEEGMLSFGEYVNGDYITGRIHRNKLKRKR